MKTLFKKIFRIVCLSLAAAMLLGAFAGCGGNTEQPGPDNPSGGNPSGNNPSGNDPSKEDPSKEDPAEKYEPYDYQVAHTSADRYVSFYSSDADLDTFLNEYRERHMRATENRIHSHPVGAGGTAWKEWEAMTGSWWDASAKYGTMPEFYATKDYVENWLIAPVQDREGYIWRDEGKNLSDWSMGWEFPDYRTGGIGWTFGDGDEGWTVNGGELSVANAVLSVSLRGAQEAELVSPDFSTASTSTPFFRACFSYEAAGGEVEDIWLYYQTEKNSGWSDSRRVSFSEFCTRGFPIGEGNVGKNGYFFPMYLCDDWGWDVGMSANVITKVKFVIKAKEGSTISGTWNFDYLATEYDDRQPLNVTNYLIAAKEILSYSQDRALLEAVMPYARRAMNFLLDQLGGREGLISTAYLKGHFNDRYKAMGTGMGNGYWDVLAFPEVNLYCNIGYYDALRAMLFLEEMCEVLGVTPERAVTVGRGMVGETEYAESVDSLKELLSLCGEKIRTYFWNEKTGRFHVGFIDGGSGKTVQDKGYVMFNEQVIASGIASEEQIASVMSWINGERTVAGDRSSGEDIYFYEFAPRFNTGEIAPDFYFGYGASFGDNVQDGGTALQNAYYDVVAQSALGSEAAYKRMEAIKAWYLKVRAAGGEGWNFYREYYKTTDISVQGGGTGGTVGLDYEFLEAALLIRSVPEAFFGLGADSAGVLHVTPALPEKLDYWRLENLTFAGYYYDLSIGKYFVQISGAEDCREGSGKSGKKVEITFEKPSFEFGIYLDGVKTDDYRTEGGKLIVTVPFQNGKVEIKGTKEA